MAFLEIKQRCGYQLSLCQVENLAKDSTSTVVLALTVLNLCADGS